MPTRRAGCAAAVLANGQICVIGGYGERGIIEGILATCELFDPYLQRWTSTFAPLVRARWGHGCAVIDDTIFVVGGCSLRHDAPPQEAFMETLRSCEVYNPSVGSWKVAADLKQPRAGARVVVLGRRYMVAVGGSDDVFGRCEVLPTLELYDVASGHWALLETQLSTPRASPAVAPIGDSQILIVGGAPLSHTDLP